MNEKAKITLSSKEQELVCNQEWILTKHIIIEKVYRLFGDLSLSMQHFILQNAAVLPAEVTSSSPKISRGENYKGLPYVMLDYPRHFTAPSTLAVRTLFWWGNFFSINLHLSGAAKEKSIPVLNAAFTTLQKEGYWICTNTDPWQHHFEEDNYVLLETYTAEDFADILYRGSFIKIAQKISLSEWNDAPEYLAQHFKVFLMLVQVSFPNGEKDPLPGIPKAGSDL